MNHNLFRTGGGPCRVDYESADGCLLWAGAIALAVIVIVLMRVFA